MIWLLLIPVIPYFLLFIILARKVPLKIFTDSDTGKRTGITIIIPCRNEEETLPGILNTIVNQNYPAQYIEVIVADDHSGDGTASTAKSYSDRLNISVTKARERGKKAAIAEAVSAAKNDLIITTDADCKAGSKWISAIAAFRSSTGADLIICPVMPEAQSGCFHEIQRLEFLSLQGVTSSSSEYGSPVMCNGANLAFTRDAYLRNRHRLHTEIESGDDMFLLHAIKKEKGKIRWLNSPDAIIKTLPPAGLKEFIRQRARWISKAGAINDLYTNVAGIVTFVTILNLNLLLVSGVINPEYLAVFAVCLLIKSVPDYLIIKRAMALYGEKHLLKWFIPAEFLYQWYVTAVVIRSFFANKWREK
jgi:cellulose synthase/poly-beta-1,6-N-acetylglucosamine synthase-like glycosyltransferase